MLNCPYAKKCGGCQLQNMTYEQQLSHKQVKVIRLVGKLCHVEEIIGMETPSRYRNKATHAFSFYRGKVISGVAKRTAPAGVPLIVIAGGIAEGAEAAYGLGVTAMFGIDREAVAFETYAHRSAENYQRTLEDILRLIRAAER